ncbi:hypothetical protein QYF36_002313 [Acer negundo]|nr:hypothetical protein QYF36_002313 [Acer negundo]
MEIDPQTYSTEENSSSQSDDELEDSRSIAKEKSGEFWFAILCILDCIEQDKAEQQTMKNVAVTNKKKKKRSRAFAAKQPITADDRSCDKRRDDQEEGEE